MAHLREEFPRLPVFSVAADQVEIGRIQGRLFRAMLPEGGDLLYIRGPLGISSAQRRFEGVQEVLQGSSVQMSAISSDWTNDGGRRATTEWLQILRKGKISNFVVGAQNDAMAMGARAALSAAAVARSDPSMARIPIIGCDGSPDYGRRLVSDGKLSATVIMPPTAGRAVSELAAIHDGRGEPAQAEIVLSPESFPDLKVLRTSRARARAG
jgi:ABC-type sugar transport system substrate-binding protein